MERRSFLLAATGTATLFPGISSLASTGHSESRENPPVKREVAEAEPGFVVRSGESRFGEQMWLGPGSPNDIKVSGRDNGGLLAILEFTGSQKGGPPLHIHPEQDEVFRILEGEFLFAVGAQRLSLRSGDTIFLPRGIPHTFAQTSEHGKMNYLFTPAGKMEDFFRKMSGLQGPPSPAEGEKLFADHGMQVVGPPLTW